MFHFIGEKKTANRVLGESDRKASHVEKRKNEKHHLNYLYMFSSVVGHDTVDFWEYQKAMKNKKEVKGKLFAFVECICFTNCVLHNFHIIIQWLEIT